ncbi:MAG: CDGSH iron-sulfur domain-containing protein [Acholeplasmataceae bacterium]|nr:CDGSH iron-sulfur domain-containing protein [Acholeplasmataceae bacterium]
MDKPVIAQKKPYQVTLEAGKNYKFCTCGRSETQPFCDLNAHKETTFKPLIFSVEKDGPYWLCGCKQSSNKPFCDGTHKTL